MVKLKAAKEQLTAGTPEWFWQKMEREQSNVMLRFIVNGGTVPPSVDPSDILRTCLKDFGSGGRPRVTTVDEKTLLKLLGTGKFSDEGIRDVLVFGGAYTVMSLHLKRPDLLPAEKLAEHIREEAMRLIEALFVRNRTNDKQLERFIRRLEKIPGFEEVIAVYAVHAR